MADEEKKPAAKKPAAKEAEPKFDARAELVKIQQKLDYIAGHLNIRLPS